MTGAEIVPTGAYCSAAAGAGEAAPSPLKRGGFWISWELDWPHSVLIAKSAIDGLSALSLHLIERTINGESAARRLAERREQSGPLVAELEDWMRTERAGLSRHAAVAKAMDYMLKRWDGFARFLDDGRICLTNNAAERALRGIATMESFYTPSSSI